MDDLIIGNQHFSSRLLLGTGKFSSPETMEKAIIASESKIITVAVRRIDFNQKKDPFTQIITPSKYIFLPNTSGARTATEAVRCAEIARSLSGNDYVKLEVTPEQNHLMPDPIETLKAAKQLVTLGFHVLPYIHADPILAKRLEDIGCAAVMPLGSPIGSNQGIQTETFIKIIIDQASIPVIIDAGLGSPSHASKAMELGADAVLVNTAIATAENPEEMASAFKLATIAGRKAFLAGLAPEKVSAEASSPLTGFLH
ncbi:thiazole synthase [bacterium]|nr:thiazole synthase [bacterium]